MAPIETQYPRRSLKPHKFRAVAHWCHRHGLKLVISLPVVAFLWLVGDVFIEDDNFRVVTPDLYRAGQLRSAEWSESLAEHHYRSVLNLRGSGPLQPWYQLERSFAEKHGLQHYDVRLSDGEEPSLETMQQLVSLMRTAPKPLLVHCHSGADRSGLAAALYLYAIGNRAKSEASGQLSLWYGHFPWLTSRTGAMDRAFTAFTLSHPERSFRSAMLTR